MSHHKVLITGGAGFIGSNFLRRFLKTHPEWEVVNFDKLTYAGNRANLQDFDVLRNYRFIQGDVCDFRKLQSAAEGCDAIIHFAAETHVDRSIDNNDDFLNTNIMGTRNILELIRQSRIKRYLHISTDEVYGSVQDGQATEGFQLKPNSPYAASKASGDLMVRAYQKTFQTPGIIARSSNNFGPYQFPEKVIPLFITNLLEKKKVPLYGVGKNRRDWIYVEDNCEALELIFDKGVDGEIYNIGGGNELSNRELTLKILSRFGLDEGFIEYVTDRPGHDFRYALDSSKLSRLGFKPRHSFDEALNQTIEWYKKHPEWWQPLRRDKFTVK